MNSKGHLYTSLIKSLLRISGVILYLVLNTTIGFAILFGVAEVLGIVEELVDWR